jgi:hypothetical protein
VALVHVLVNILDGAHAAANFRRLCDSCTSTARRDCGAPHTGW